MSIYSLKIRAIFALTVSALLSFFSQSHAATLTWDANGTTALQTDGLGDWLNADQWWNGSANVTWTSGDDAVFGNGGAGGAVTLATPTTINSITFNPFTGTYTIGTAGQTITLNNGITMKSGAGIVSIISPITLGGAQSWTNNSASLLTIGTGAVTNGGFLLTIGGTGNTTISSAIDGSGGLTKSGSGILTLSEVNTYSGTTTVNAGTPNAQWRRPHLDQYLSGGCVDQSSVRQCQHHLQWRQHHGHQHCQRQYGLFGNHGRIGSPLRPVERHPDECQHHP